MINHLAKNPIATFVYKESDYATWTNPEYKWDNSEAPGCMTEFSVGLTYANYLISKGAKEVIYKDMLQIMRNPPKSASLQVDDLSIEEMAFFIEALYDNSTKVAKSALNNLDIGTLLTLIDIWNNEFPTFNAVELIALTRNIISDKILNSK